MTVAQGALLAGSALIGGALNAVAGGGSFFTFPALLFCGVSPVAANATSTVALVPGSLGSALAYRPDLRCRDTWVLLVSSLAGGLGGALVLLRMREATFAHLVPYLMLAATLLFALGGPVAARLRVWTAKGGASPRALAVAAILQLLVALYGGFFGGGMGILMLALFAVLGLGDLHRMNALKTLLASCINGVAVVAFVAARVVRWPEALLMAAAAVAGGYGGAQLAKRLPVRLVRRFVILYGAALTTYVFLR